MADVRVVVIKMVNNKMAFDLIQKAKTKQYDVTSAEAEIRILDYIMENRLDETTIKDLTKDLSYMYTCVFCKEEIKPPEGIYSLATITRNVDDKSYMFTMCKECTKSYFEHKNKLYGEDMGKKRLDRNRNSQEYGKYLPAKPNKELGFDKLERKVVKKISDYIQTGIFEDFLSYVPDGSRFDNCVFCDLNLADLPLAQSRRIELIYLPVGQSNRIHGPVKVCPTCSTHKRSLLKVPNDGHFNQVKSVTCSVSGKPYTVTLEEYNSGDYAGNIILHGSTGFSSQQANRKHWGSPRFEYPTCTGCQRTFVKDKLFLLTKDHKLCSDCMAKTKSKLPSPVAVNHADKLQTFTVSLDRAVSCIISEVRCNRGEGTSFLQTFIIKLDFMNKVNEVYGPEVYQEFLKLIPLEIKNGRLLEDVSSYFEKCPDRGSCYCNATIEEAAVDAGISYASYIWSKEYEEKLNELVKNIEDLESSDLEYIE